MGALLIIRRMHFETRSASRESSCIAVPATRFAARSSTCKSLPECSGWLESRNPASQPPLGRLLAPRCLRAKRPGSTSLRIALNRGEVLREARGRGRLRREHTARSAIDGNARFERPSVFGACLVGSRRKKTEMKPDVPIAGIDRRIVHAQAQQLGVPLAIATCGSERGPHSGASRSYEFDVN